MSPVNGVKCYEQGVAACDADDTCLGIAVRVDASNQGYRKCTESTTPAMSAPEPWENYGTYKKP